MKPIWKVQNPALNLDKFSKLPAVTYLVWVVYCTASRTSQTVLFISTSTIFTRYNLDTITPESMQFVVELESTEKVRTLIELKLNL
jgi:hypothetical protein